VLDPLKQAEFYRALAGAASTVEDKEECQEEADWHQEESDAARAPQLQAMSEGGACFFVCAALPLSPTTPPPPPPLLPLSVTPAAAPTDSPFGTTTYVLLHHTHTRFVAF